MAQPATLQQMPDIADVLTALQQAGFDQSVIDSVESAVRTQSQTHQTITQMSTNIASLQSIITTQQRTLSSVQRAQQQLASQPTTKIQTNVKIEKPTKFDGVVKNFKDWLFNFEQYATITGLDQQPIEQAQYAVTLFEKSALTWWQVAIKSQPQTLNLTTMSWQTLKSELETHFVDVDRERKLLHTFRHFTQLNDLHSYITNFRRIVLELGKLVTDEVVLWQFIQGLKPSLQREVLKDPNLQVVSDAILIAERIDAADKFSTNFQNYKNKQQQYRKQLLNDPSVPMDIDTLYQMFTQQNSSRNNNNNNNTRGNKQNNNRGGKNSNQRGNYNNNTRNSGRSSTQNSANHETECYYCRKKGHYARNCFQKQRDDAQQQLYAMQQQVGGQQNLNNVQQVLPLPPSTQNDMQLPHSGNNYNFQSKN